jgi:serine/threonine-protein kinase
VPQTSTHGYQRFFAELKRRKVFRLAAFYGTAGFVAVQAADVFVPALGLPPFILRVVAFLVIAGFPVALLVAWLYERTPQGLKRTADAAEGEIDALVAELPSRRWPAGLAALAGVALIALSGWWLATGRIRGTGTYDSIAVLPFANLSDDPAGERFADGLTEELLNGLGGVEDLRVAARTSSFAFKGTNLDVRTIADSLGVATVLEGSVRREGDRARITVQLVDSERGFQLWSADYDRELRDVFTVQDEIAAEVVRALAPRLRPADRETLVRGGTTDAAAYDLYLQGREKWRTRETPALVEAIDDFRAAIARDSSFALAWSGLADAIDALAWRETPYIHLVPEARNAALRALAIDPELAEAWVSAGILAAEFDLDRKAGEMAVRRAIQLRPSYAFAQHQLSSILRNTGRVEEAGSHIKKAVELDPLSPLVHETYALHLLVVGDAAGAREQQEIAAGLFPGSFNHAGLVWYAKRLGMQPGEAAAAAEAFARARGVADPIRWRVVGSSIVDGEMREEALAIVGASDELEDSEEYQLRLALEDHETFLAWLEEEWKAGAADLFRLGVLPQYDPVRSDPRFIAIVRDLGTPNGYDPVTKTVNWP